MGLSDNAKKIVESRYLMYDEKNWEDVCKRVSTYVSAAEVIYTLKIDAIREFNRQLYEDLVNCDFIFNSPTLFNAGNGVDPELLYKPIDELTMDDYEEIYAQRNPKNSLSACFVIPVNNSIDGIFNAVKESSIISKCIPEYQEIFTYAGNKKISDITIGDKVVDRDGKFYEVEELIPSGQMEVYRITTNKGLSFDCTLDHKFLAVTNLLRTKWAVSKKSELKFLKISEFNDSTGIVLSKLPIIEGEDPVVEWGFTYKSDPEKGHFLPKSCKIPYKIDERLAWLLGYFIGNGSYHNDGVRFYVNVKYSDVEDHIEKMLYELFDLKASKLVYNEKNVVELALYNMRVKEFFKWIIGEDKHVVPDIIKKASIKTRWAFITGLFDSDGCVNTNGNVSISTSYLQLNNDLLFLFNSLGVYVSSHKHLAKIGYTRYLDSYCLSPLTIDDYNKFYDNLISVNSFRSSRLRKDKFTERGICKYKDFSVLKIKSIEKLDKYMCYNLTVKNVHEYMISQFVSKNSGGGVGYNFSHLSHKGRPLDSGVGKASGPLSFMSVFESAAQAVMQGGRRRAAQLGTLRYDHPDIMDFIHAKADKKSFKFFNLSVLVDDYFMKAVDEDLLISLIDPVDGKVVNTIPAKEIFDAIAKQAWETGDPGLLFYDALNRDGYVQDAVIESTNPCQPGDALLLDGDHLQYIDPERVTHSDTWRSWKTGTKEVLELTCNNGMIVRFTPEHKIMLSDGTFIQAQESLNKTLMWGLGNRTASNIIEDDVLRGFLFGDGFITGGGLGIGVKIDSKKEPEVVKLLLDNGFHQQDNGSFYISKDALGIDISFLEDRVFNRKFPEEVLLAKSDVVASFLRGLFEANGSCVGSSSQISLKSTNRDMLKDVQILLASFDIPSWLVTNQPKVILWKNGEYVSRESYNLQIAPRNADLFKEKIGFYSDTKNAKIKKFKEPYKGTLEVVAICSLGEQDVYDYTMYTSPHHNFCQGVIASNCGEIGTYFYGSCNLGHINLNNMVHAETKSLNYNKYVQLIHRSIRYLDDIIDMNWYPLKEITRFAASYRPIGLGVMGLAHALFKLQMPYKSDSIVDMLAKVLMTESTVASIELAKQRGSYPEYDYNVWMKKSTSKRLTSLETKNLELYGIRNAAINTSAPTGTCALVADTSSGIEPVFSLEHTRIYIDKDGKEKELHVFDPVYQEWLDNHSSDGIHAYEPIPDYFVDASHISIEEHIKMQSVWQQYIDQSISKTINMPNSATVEDVKKAYLLAYQLGCKGITIFRDGCREDQILSTGTKVSGTVPKPRPKVTYGRTSEVKIGCGTLYITLNLDDNGKPIEAFITTGKGGGCRASSEGLGRMISVNLRSGIAVEEIIKQLEHIKCPSCVNKGNIKVKSCPDAVSKELKSIISDKNLQNDKGCDIVVIEEDKGIKCEECGSIMMMQEGCRTCPNCGFSKCI